MCAVINALFRSRVMRFWKNGAIVALRAVMASLDTRDALGLIGSVVSRSHRSLFR